MGRRSPMRTSKRPFPPGFTPVPASHALSIGIPREECEPIFLSPSLRSPILELEPSEYPSLETTSEHSCSSTSYSKSQTESYSRPSARTIKMICQSVLKLKKSRSRPDLSNALIEHTPTTQEKLPMLGSFSQLTLCRTSTPSSISHKPSFSSLQSNLNQPITSFEAPFSRTEPIEVEESRFQEPIEELQAEAIRKAECEKGHRRQRSNDLLQNDRPLFFDNPIIISAI
ncbi:uncharacterized protein MELLADRAFT_65741 [Melampsora larici-populina 98AG31]|uniref:Uncharacterized protein n=1 Tax=Melampsora larici-populina (strain 98AG31 / pathotype 3-4-7) TaxID=747676 RepID=F4RWJ1_MELLP|nr:uncharacterized protein MELLADRAFT_65741 [Melampsora larici-populina 98AG31]EGG03312.1 hypothetical protein MELLADRAFT_65741 [Melampsora larici-populina 98AG31]